MARSKHQVDPLLPCFLFPSHLLSLLEPRSSSAQFGSAYAMYTLRWSWGSQIGDLDGTEHYPGSICLMFGEMGREHHPFGHRDRMCCAILLIYLFLFVPSWPGSHTSTNTIPSYCFSSTQLSSRLSTCEPSFLTSSESHRAGITGMSSGTRRPGGLLGVELVMWLAELSRPTLSSSPLPESPLLRHAL